MRWINQTGMMWMCVGLMAPVYGIPQKPAAGHPPVQVVTPKKAGTQAGSHKGKRSHGANVSVASSVRERASSRVGVPAASSQVLAHKGGQAASPGQHSAPTTSSPPQPQAMHAKDHTPKPAQAVGASEKTDAALQHRASLVSKRQEIQKVLAQLKNARDDALTREKALQAIQNTKPSVAQDVGNVRQETQDIKRALNQDIKALDKLDESLGRDIHTLNQELKNKKQDIMIR